MAYTNDQSLNTKVDSTQPSRRLAGPEHIPTLGKHDDEGSRVPTGMQNVQGHLPYSPAAGFPLQISEFHLGHKWSEVDGKVQAQSGRYAI